MFVEILKNDREWTDFVETTRSASIYHSLKWRDVIQRTFDLQPLYLLIKDDSGRVVGVCPSFIKQISSFKICDSLFFSDYGGPVIERLFSKRGMLLLRNFLQDFLPNMGVDFARVNFLAETDLSFFFKQRSAYVDKSSGVMEVDLSSSSSDFLWNKVFSHGQRNQFRRAEESEFQVQEAQSKSDLVDFYNLYSQNMGFSVDSFKLIENIWSILHPDNLRLYLLRKDNAVAATLFVLLSERGSYVRYSAVDRHMIGSRFSGSDYLRWLEVKRAEQEGKSLFSLGTTSSDPSHPFHIQKIRNGARFHLQEKMLYPYSFMGYAFVFMKGKAVPIWTAANKFLPIRLEGLLEDTLSRLNSL